MIVPRTRLCPQPQHRNGRDAECHEGDALESKREEWGLHLSDSGADFEIKLRGGGWTSGRRGVAYDVVRAKPKAGEATEWAKRYVGQLSKSHSIKQYSEAGAFALCRAWTTRMQKLYDIYLGSQNPLHEYTEEDVHSTLLTDAEVEDVVKKVEEGKGDAVRTALLRINEIRPTVMA